MSSIGRRLASLASCHPRLMTAGHVDIVTGTAILPPALESSVTRIFSALVMGCAPCLSAGVPAGAADLVRLREGG